MTVVQNFFSLFKALASPAQVPSWRQRIEQKMSTDVNQAVTIADVGF